MKRFRQPGTSKDSQEDCASEDAHLDKVKREIAANLHKQNEMEELIAALGRMNEPNGNQDIADVSTLVANETQSVALSEMLSHMWKEMRTFESPAYAERKKKELLDLRHEEHVLEKKLAGAEKKKHACAFGQTTVNEVKAKDGLVSEDNAVQQDEAAQRGTDVTDNAAKEPTRLKWNFWTMKAQQKRSVLEGTLVYLVFGLLAAFLYKKASSKYSKFFLPETRPDIFQGTRDFSFPLFECFGAPKLCFLGFCCPCLMWADTLDRKNILPYWKAFAAFFGLLLMHVYTFGISSILVVMLGVKYRQQLRALYRHNNHNNHKGKETLALDVLTWWCCQPCAIIQEAREDSIIRDHSMVNP